MYIWLTNHKPLYYRQHNDSRCIYDKLIIKHCITDNIMTVDVYMTN
jgi:hypothetical protein